MKTIHSSLNSHVKQKCMYNTCQSIWNHSLNVMLVFVINFLFTKVLLKPYTKYGLGKYSAKVCLLHSSVPVYPDRCDQCQNLRKFTLFW